MTRIFPIMFLLAVPGLVAQSATPAQAAAPIQVQDPVQNQVTVTANRTSTPLGETAKTTYTLSPSELHDYPAVTLDESLRQHAGFELFRRAGSRIANPTSEGISLRGLGSTAASRTLVIEDGAPLNDPFGGYIHWSEQPAPTIQSVTLVTGGGSDLYGSSALGGVIDVLPSPIAPADLDLSAIGGSQSTSDLTAVAARSFRPLAAMLAAESLRTGGYIVSAPALAGAVDVPANVLSQAYRTELGRRGFASDRLFLTANLLNESRSNGTPLQTNATRLWRYLGGYDMPETRVASGRVRLFGSDEGYRQSFSAIAAGRGSETLTRLQRVHTQELGGSADATLHLFSTAAALGPPTLVFGADYRDIRASDDETPIAANRPTGLQDVTARQRFFGGFGELLAAHRPWSLAASLRADRASNLDIVQTMASLATSSQSTLSQSRPPHRTEVVLSPRIGIIRTLGRHADLHASGFRAFRTPTMNELYRTGQVGQEITQANAGLLSERATGYEAGMLLTPSTRVPATLQATYFWTEMNRPVSAVLVSQTATSITDMRENLGQIRSRGVELALDIRPRRAVSGTLGYQYAVATVTRFSAQPTLVGNWIPQVPRQSFTAQLRAANRRLGEVTLAARSSGRAYDDANNQFPLNGFFSLDLSGGRELGRRLGATFLVQNLTNQRPQVSRTPILTLGSPIFAEAGLTFRLGRSAAP